MAVNHISTPFQRIISFGIRHWIIVFASALGLYVGLPFLAPVFMRIGWLKAGKIIYSLYSVFCHQLPQRSFFLFGSKTMYSLNEIQAVWQNTDNPFLLRQFIGNPDLGWKVAWSDRMVSMYTSLLIFGLLWLPIHHRLRPLAWWGLILTLLPLALDGTTHFISDFSGLGQGFRDSNLWLANLTGSALAPGFYGGDAPGSFNSWMRLISGVFFGLGIVWYSFPYLDAWRREYLSQT